MYRISIPRSDIVYNISHPDEVVDKIEELIAIRDGKVKISDKEIRIRNGGKEVEKRSVLHDEFVDEVTRIAEIKRALTEYGKIRIDL